MARRRFIIPGAPFLNKREVLVGLADGAQRRSARLSFVDSFPSGHKVANAYFAMLPRPVRGGPPKACAQPGRGKYLQDLGWDRG
jgi:hypothetical protein